MKFQRNNPPRRFRVGAEKRIVLKDCGSLRLAPNEQVTFVTASGKRHDFVAKSWGFYATPSTNARLAAQGLKTAIVRNHQGRYYVLVVDKERLREFRTYLEDEKNKVVRWLDRPKGRA